MIQEPIISRTFCPIIIFPQNYSSQSPVNNFAASEPSQSFFMQNIMSGRFSLQIEQSKDQRIRQKGNRHHIKKGSIPRRLKSVRKSCLCSVCLTKIKKNSKIHNTECRHNFHVNCLGKWIRNKNTCPNCRQKIKQGNNDQLYPFGF